MGKSLSQYQESAIIKSKIPKATKLSAFQGECLTCRKSGPDKFLVLAPMRLLSYSIKICNPRTVDSAMTDLRNGLKEMSEVNSNKISKSRTYQGQASVLF